MPQATDSPNNPWKTLEELQVLLGYRFHDLELLVTALRHRPAVSENFFKNPNLMEPLATLGETILGAVIADKLYEEGNREKGTLTIEMVRKSKHARSRKFAEKIQLRKYIQWENEEGENWARSNSALDTVFEALTGAVFTDAKRSRMNGMEIVRDMLERSGFFGR